MIGEVRFYLGLFLRRIHYFLFIFLSISAIAVTISQILPSTYMSQTTLLVEPPQIPGQLQAPTVQVTPQEELQIIEQRLMTRANLLDIAHRQNVYENMDEMTPDEIVARMSKDTSIKQVAGRGQATLMFISFTARDGQIAANVINEYVTLILRNNTQTRTERANNTLEFFQAEVARLGKLLQQQSAKITEFKNANIDALPDTLNYRLTQQSTAQSKLASVEQQITGLEEQRRSIVDLFNQTGQVGNANVVNLTPEQQKLAQLQDSLTQALAVYSPENPKVKLIQSQIRKQEEIVANQVATTGVNPNSPSTLLDINLAGIDAQLKLLREQKAQLTKQLADLEETLQRTPGNSITLDGLNRDYLNTQAQYNNAVSSLAKASMGERIETLSKGQRIAVVDPASVPELPSGPKRKLIAAAGILAGLGAGLGFVFLLEFFNKSIRRPTEISRGLGITPIATVPYVRTPGELVLRRAGIALVLLLVAAGIPAALYAVDTYYMPLDLIYAKISQKFGGLI